MVMACGTPQRLASDRSDRLQRLRGGRRGPQQEHQREENNKISGTQPKRGAAPSEIRDHELSEIGHDALANGATGRNDAHREALARVEPQPGQRQHRREQASKADRADEKIEQIELPEPALPSQRGETRSQRDRSEDGDLPRTDAIRKAAPDEAADRSTDGVHRVGHGRIGAEPAKFLLERLDEDRNRGAGAEAEREADGRYRNDHPAIGMLVELIARDVGHGHADEYDVMCMSHAPAAGTSRRA